MADSDDKGRAGRRAKPNDLVRPYVLRPGGNGQRRPPAQRRAPVQRDTPVQGDSADRLIRGDRPALDWTADAGSRRTLDARPEPGAHKDLAVPPPTTALSPLPPTPSEPRQAALSRQPATYWLDWLRSRAGRRWLMAAAAGGAVLAVAAGMILTRQPPRVLADTCGTANCHRTVPGTSGAQASPHKTSGRSHSGSAARRSPTQKRHPAPRPTSSAPTPRSTAASPSPKPSPTGSPTPTPTPTPSATKKPAKVSYTFVGQMLLGGFQGQFTIVNQASTPIDNWELAAVLPGDHIQSVWFGSYHTNGDTLYIDPASNQRKIGSGQSVTENFTASGPTTAPTSCTFNGSPC